MARLRVGRNLSRDERLVNLAELPDIVPVERIVKPAVVDAGDRDGHGAVQKDLPIVQLPLVMQATEMKQDVLRAPHRKSRES